VERTSLQGSEAWIQGRLTALAFDCARETAVDGGSVTLVSTKGARIVCAATSGLATALEDSQTLLGEGPSVDALDGPGPVLVANLADPLADWPGKWPFFAAQADELDVRAVFAFPIRVQAVSVGTFGLYRQGARGLDDQQLSRARTAAEDIAELLVAPTVTEDPGQPTGVSRTRRVSVAWAAHVHQAAGMVMVQADVSVVEAMDLMRAAAFAEEIELRALAREVIERRRKWVKGAAR